MPSRPPDHTLHIHDSVCRGHVQVWAICQRRMIPLREPEALFEKPLFSSRIRLFLAPSRGAHSDEHHEVRLCSRNG